MIFQELSQFKYQVKKALNKMAGLNKCRKKFFIHTMGLYLGIKGRINFLQLERYGNHDEQSFRNQFEKPFDFMRFNKELIFEHGSGHYTIAFDPSYISKSGKKTLGLGYFWSGCAGKAKGGLEICGIGDIDIENHTAFHLDAQQTLQEDEFQSLLDYYADVIVSRKKELQSVSKYVVADAYFSKENFISKLCNHGFEVVTRLRDDADLRYKYLGEKKKGRGRPQKYDGKVDYKQLKDGYFSLTQSDENVQIYSGIVYSKSLKKDINIVLLRSKRKQKWVHKIYMTTDLELSADKILQYYQTRFQIEFLYRDGKQHTGLNDSQARCKNKLNFHFNMSLTAINIAKVTHWHIKQQYNEQGYLNYITAEISSPLGRSGGAWKAHIQRNARGQATACEFTGGVQSSFEYDNDGRPIAQTVKNGLGRESYKRSYHWNAANQLIQTIDHIKNKGIRYTYDALNQLVSAAIGSSETELKNPDAVGNLYETPERTDRKYESGGKLTKDKNWHYYYDTLGNLKLKSPYPLHGKEPSKKWQMGCWHYEWYANGMLKSVQKPSGAIVGFEYDALGRRTAKIAGKKITRYLWDGNVLLQEWKYDIAERPVLQVGELGALFYNKSEPIENLVTWIYEEGGFTPIATIKEDKYYSIVSDYMGTPKQGYDIEGNLIWQRELDVYGNPVIGKNDFMPFLYQGQYVDLETGDAYNRFRYYSPETGLYLSQDPIGILGANSTLYAYVKDVNSSVDIFGLHEVIAILDGNPVTTPKGGYSWYSTPGSSKAPFNGFGAAGHSEAKLDRKSTRLNSSHVRISYAVFCLKKK